MVPTNSEVIFWGVLAIISIGLWAWGATKPDHDEYVSDHWIDRNIYGKK